MFMRRMSQIPRSTFNAVLARWLKFRGFTGLDRTHVDHNVCPTSCDLKFKEDRAELYLAEARRALNEALVGDDANDDESIEVIQMRLNTLQEELAVLQREKAEHAEFNAHCRSIIAWWRGHAIKAHVKWERSSSSRSRSPARSPERASEPLICILHYDGEASRKIPHCRFDSDGGGFEGQLIKNVAFADMVTGETANFFMPHFIRTESSSTLIDMIL